MRRSASPDSVTKSLVRNLNNHAGYLDCTTEFSRRDILGDDEVVSV